MGTNRFSNIVVKKLEVTNSLQITGTGVPITADEFNVLSGVTAGTVTASKAVVASAAKNIGRFETITADALDLSSGTPASHPINLEGLTLPANSNVIRGASINPTRLSGWTSFSGAVTTTPAQVYTDFRQLTTAGVAEVLGIGSFPTMLTGASCASMFGLQSICQVDAGATVLTAGGAPAVGIFPIFAKVLLDGETFNSGGVAAAIFASIQANVTDVQAQNVSFVNLEVASGGIQNVIKMVSTAAKGATYFANLPNNGEPAEKQSASTTQVNDVVGNIKVLIGDQVGYINIHSAKAA